jgi:tetratricopeptide (TPR) repeat protein
MGERPVVSRLTRVFWLGAALAGATLAAAQELGTITFPTSGEPAAQPKFLEGVKALHSFQFDEAALAFREAQRIDRDFALAYWGEAMSFNHPLWAQQDLDAARRVLERLAPTPEARIAKAALPTEQAFIAAADRLFYGADDKLARDIAYSEAMAAMYERWPGDHEVATFYALSLLGTVRAGDGGGFRRQALAASVAQQVFEENPNHPGAAHFIIHSFDDPEHAPLGLPAARAYAAIAPAAAHALHMPSHIFVQLGMWDDVVRSNVSAHAAAVEINTRLNLPEGREDFHTLSWLMYGNLMLGRYDDARANVALARAAAERNPDNAGIRDGWLAMRGRYLLETGQWEEIARDGNAAHASHDDSMPGMPMAQAGAGAWRFYAGASAAKRGDAQLAEQFAADFAALREQVARTSEYNSRGVAIQEKEVAALAKVARGDLQAALAIAKEAADLELTLATPSGPPDMLKPAQELYGELLLAAGRPSDAMRAFEQQLLRTPRRTPALLGLARAAAEAGAGEVARRSYTTLRDMKGAAPQAPAVVEATAWLGAN